jgi:hypothetical protein
MKRASLKKWFALVLLGILFLLLTSVLSGCVTDSTTPPTQNDVEMAQTTIAIASFTPTPPPFPFEKPIVEALNNFLQMQRDLTHPLDQLSITIDASYIVNRVVLQGATLIIEVHCECALNGDCCNMEHTFMVITQAMNDNQAYFQLITSDITDFQLACYDHAKPLGTMQVSWFDMQGFMHGNITGYQLGGAVTKNPSPKSK